jgi:replicative DNA helicase Mcm
MEAAEQIKKFGEFFEGNYKKDILKGVREDKRFLVVDFNELSKFDPDLANLLLDQPEEVIKAAELAIEQLDLKTSNFRVRFTNLSESQKVMIRNIRSAHIGKLLVIEGVVRQKSDVRPQVTAAKFECPSCGNIQNVLQLDSSFKEPSRCGCGRKGKFRELSKELVDAQGIVLEEAAENLEGGEQPKRINILLKEDLVSPLSERKTNPGSKISVTGVIKDVPIIMRTGSKSTRFDLIIESNYVVALEETFSEIDITDEEEGKIKDLAADPKVNSRLVNSIAPSIYGYDSIKESLLFQLLGGVRKVRKDSVVSRGDMHILLVGDPGAGKSALLKRINLVAPKGRYISGKGISAAGLTASVVKDEFLKGWSLEAGAMVLSSNGICCTTGDSQFILNDGKRMAFQELFDKTDKSIIYPKFKVLALNTNTLKIEPFEIKHAIKIKNAKKVFKITTRTGREINLTEDNDVLVSKDSDVIWKSVESLNKNEFIAVPKRIILNNKDTYSRDFAYIAGLIASDGHIRINSRRATTRFYNTDKLLIEVFKEKMKKLGYKYNIFIQKKGRKSIIRNKEVTSKKDLYMIYNSTKAFAKKFILFGVKSGNKSTKFALDNKISTYSDATIASFLKGVFDGDGSIRLNPIEVSLTSGIKENARLFQEALTRLGIISSVKKSTNCWHCEVRGAVNCIKFFNIIGTNHTRKYNLFERINPQEVKDRVDILPNQQRFFKELIKRYSWKLGKNKFKYFWNYSRNGVNPSIYKLELLNRLLDDPHLTRYTQSDILWDKIVSIKEINSEYVYDFTMKGTNNFIANGVIMHNCIDEMDKMSPEDTSAMHEALENQTVSISKANIQATLISRTTVLAAANPKFGRFDPYGVVADQINLPPALINRFDLIFTIKDLPDEKKDRAMAAHMLSLHQNPDIKEPEIPTNLLKKYIAYAKQKISPKLTDGAIKDIQDYYIKMRMSGGGEGVKTIQISPRQLEALVRLSESSARVRLSDKVTKKDTKKAIELLEYSMTQVGLDKETGKIDIDRIATGIPASQRNNIMIIKEVIKEIEARLGVKTIPIDDIMEESKSKGVNEEKTEEALEKLKRVGEIFEPRRGFIQGI